MKQSSDAFSESHKTLAQRLATPVEEDVELKTICSALKLFLRTLKEPIFTFKLHNRFIEAASRAFLSLPPSLSFTVLSSDRR